MYTVEIVNFQDQEKLDEAYAFIGSVATPEMQCSPFYPPSPPREWYDEPTQRTYIARLNNVIQGVFTVNDKRHMMYLFLTGDEVAAFQALSDAAVQNEGGPIIAATNNQLLLNWGFSFGWRYLKNGIVIYDG